MPSRRQQIVSFGIPSTAVATIVTAALLHPGAPGPTRDPGPVVIEQVPEHVIEQPGGTEIDVVFAVDTTGSMGGLLDSAKRTVWSIASHIRETDPNANLRIGLVAYRDLGEDYVTRPFALTSDLDAVYGELSGYQAQRGGDTPENVDAALDATLKMKWRRGAKKLVFVVGDAPPASRGDVPTFDVLAQRAADRGITINAIRCGWDAETEASFRKLASIGRGEYSSIQQNGGVQQVATPYDAELAELSARIDRTAVIIGDEGARAGYGAKMAAAESAPAPAKADRAAYYVRKARATKGGADVRAADDLVGAYAAGGAPAATIDGLVASDKLPAELRGKDKAELTAELAKRAAERSVVQRAIAEVAAKRDAYLRTQAGPTGFDAEVKKTVAKQLKK